MRNESYNKKTSLTGEVFCLEHVLFGEGAPGTVLSHEDDAKVIDLKRVPLPLGDVDTKHAGIATHMDALHLNALVVVEYGIHAATHKHNGLA